MAGGLLTRGRLTLAIASMALVLFALSLGIGPDGLGLPADATARRLILLEIRLPRAILGFLVGGTLGLCGAVLQGYLRNPLAEPGLLGVSGGASLGAVVAIHSGVAGAFALALPLGGLLGAGAATLAVVLLAGERSAPISLILAGVAISSLAAALTALALNLAPNPFASVEILYWTMGSLSDRSLLHVWIAAPLMLVGSALLMWTGSSLDALTLGEDAAQNLGADLTRLRRVIVAGVSLGVGAATAVAGSIGFVGLVVPHLLRPLAGFEPRRLLAPSFFGGAALVLAADVAVRIVSPSGDVKLGVVTALVGAPFFFWLVVATRRELVR
ncbi:MAG: iron ABC transporter permease [Hyphomicrobiaceae bacterium]|nr:iron ABC transporter permease [Hyphomicrobiaceae bacterium]